MIDKTETPLLYSLRDEDKPVILGICCTLVHRYIPIDHKHRHHYEQWIDKIKYGAYTTPQIACVFAYSLSTTEFNGAISPGFKELLREIEAMLKVAYSGGLLFTTKHYVKIGESIGKAIENITKSTNPADLEKTLAGMSVIVTELTNTFKEDNPRFKRGDFLKSIVTKPKEPGT